jgi:hypothetical protein
MATIQFDPIGKFKYTKNDMGQYHSYDDEPAIDYVDGSCKIWYKNGLIHRNKINGPSIISKNIDNTINEEYYWLGKSYKYLNDDIKKLLIDKIIIKHNLNHDYTKILMSGDVCIINNNNVKENVNIIIENDIIYEVGFNDHDIKTEVLIDNIYIMTDKLTTKEEIIKNINVDIKKYKQYITVKDGSERSLTLYNFSSNINIYINKITPTLFGSNMIYKFINQQLNIFEYDITELMKLKLDYLLYKFSIHPKLQELFNFNIKINNFDELITEMKYVFREQIENEHSKLTEFNNTEYYSDSSDCLSKYTHGTNIILLSIFDEPGKDNLCSLFGLKYEECKLMDMWINRDEFITLIIEKFYTPEFIAESCFI